MSDQMAGLENATKDLSGRMVLITGGAEGLAWLNMVQEE
jgi:hypothetical protein